MKIVHRTLTWLVTILLPFALIFLGLRLFLTHAFLEMEYRTPGFPEDSYGFTLEDRLHYSKITFDYALYETDISFLGDLTFTDGSPFYNARELRHMEDVRRLLQPVMWIGYGIWFFLLGLGLWARFGRWWREYLNGIRFGGWLTVGLTVSIAAIAAAAFWQFFAAFHSLFFEGDTWLFLYSDSLIRLFPMRFWQDTFLLIGVVSLVGGLCLALGLKPKAS